MGRTARRLGALAVCLTAGLFAFPASSNDAPLTPPSLKDRLFAFGGVDTARGSTSAWMGLVASPLTRLRDNGMRIRVMGGYGRYSYDTSNVPGGVNDGDYTSGEFMLGWRHDIRGVIVTTYLGGHIEHHSLANPDPGNPVTGTTAGIKAIVELFARPAPGWIASANASLSSVYAGYSLRGMIARELNPKLLLGLEAAFLGNERYHEPRAGLAAQFMWGEQILSLAAGALDNSDKGTGYYLTTSLYLPF